MITLGLISSFFGGLTFALLLWFLNAGPDQVEIGWFVESAISASLIIPVILKRISYGRIR
jgi:Mg2+-importing ATPase